jgi:hypothetical protein
MALEPPEVVIYGSNDYQFMISTNTLGAQETLTEISDNERICLLQTSIVGHRIVPDLPDTQLGGNSSQFTSVSLAAYQAGLGVSGHHQADNIFPKLLKGRRVGLDDHVGGYERNTRGQQPPSPDLFHQTEATGASRAQVAMMAEGGNLDTMVQGRTEDARARETTDISPVNGQMDFVQMSGSSRSRSSPIRQRDMPYAPVEACKYG